MSNVSERRARMLQESLLEHGETEAARKAGVSVESLHRMIRTLNLSRTYNHPKILLFDIETSPNVSYNWGFFKENIRHEQIVFPWQIISWSGKWLYSDEVFGDVLTIEEAKNHTDKRICESLIKALSDANIVIGHNGKKFDRKRSNARFFINKLRPPTQYQVIDTLEQLRKEFVMPSNRLDYLLKLMYDDSKLETSFALWPKCLNWFGKYSDKEQQEALDYMFKYNKKDTFVLEELYLDLRPWIKSHPNLAVMAESRDERCHVCLSTDIEECGYYYTPAGRFESVRCKQCGSLSRRRINQLSKEEKRNLLIPHAR